MREAAKGYFSASENFYEDDENHACALSSLNDNGRFLLMHLRPARVYVDRSAEPGIGRCTFFRKDGMRQEAQGCSTEDSENLGQVGNGNEREGCHYPDEL